MRTLLLTLAGSGLLALPAAGQTPPPAPADTARTYKHHLGLTASPQLDKFFTANRVLPLGLFYRRQLTPAKALRLRLVGQFSHSNVANFADAPTILASGYVTGPDYNYWQLHAFVGYEWQRLLTQRVGLTYGLETGIGYERQQYNAVYREIYPPGGSADVTDTRTSQEWQLQLRPFVSLCYQPTTRLRLFAESAFSAAYARHHYEHNGRSVFTNGEQDRFLNLRTQSNRFTTSWRPIQFIGAAYAF